MRYSNLKVDQINKKGEIILDFGEILSQKEIGDQINSNFNCEKNNMFSSIGKYHEQSFCICFKNVSYLGTPHSIYKKRIQIPETFIKMYFENQNLEIKTFFIGVYNYKDNLIFVDFDTSNYINNKGNNSSAHVLTIDLVNAVLKGIYTKRDINNNKITAFTPDFIETFLQSKLYDTIDLKSDIVNIFDQFFDSLPKNWYGINCYQEMMRDDFNQKFQPEWPGFYLEYKFNKYINNNYLNDIVTYKQNKKNGEIDLDLYFPKTMCYGDLKAHSITSSAIQGNDYNTIMEVVKTHPIYYIVFNHSTIKDSDNDYKVTFYWNSVQNKKNIKSYSAKMKASIKLKSYMILEINNVNVNYLSEFKQGHNSNGKNRQPKIMIKKRNIDNFIIHFKKIDNDDNEK